MAELEPSVIPTDEAKLFDVPCYEHTQPTKLVTPGRSSVDVVRRLTNEGQAATTKYHD